MVTNLGNPQQWSQSNPHTWPACALPAKENKGNGIITSNVIAVVEELLYEINQSGPRSKTINNEPKQHSRINFNEFRVDVTIIYSKFSFFYMYLCSKLKQCVHLNCCKHYDWEELLYETTQSDPKSKTTNNEPKPDSGLIFNGFKVDVAIIHVKFAIFSYVNMFQAKSNVFTQNRCKQYLQKELLYETTQSDPRSKTTNN